MRRGPTHHSTECCAIKRSQRRLIQTISTFKVTGAARLHRAASRERSERGRPQGWASLCDMKLLFRICWPNDRECLTFDRPERNRSKLKQPCGFNCGFNVLERL